MEPRKGEGGEVQVPGCCLYSGILADTEIAAVGIAVPRIVPLEAGLCGADSEDAVGGDGAYP
jgi:hypothetical protein